MANQITQSGKFLQTDAEFGSVALLPFAPLSDATASSTPGALGQCALPANVKILSLAAVAAGPAGSGPLMLNICSGTPPAATMGAGTITLGGTATAAGTLTVVVASAVPGFTQQISVPISNGTTAATAATLTAGYINIAPSPQQITALTPSGAAVSILQLSSQSYLSSFNAPQTYYAISTAPGLTATPTQAAPGTFPASSGFNVGTPDNYYTSTPTSTFASSGQYLLGTFGSFPVSVAGTNTVVYAALNSVGFQTSPLNPPVSVAQFDIVFPVTRPLTLVGLMPNETGAVTVSACALVRPVVLNPTNPTPAQGPWTPNRNTIGAPSTA